MDSSSSSSLHHQAIEAALCSRWNVALKLNKQIIKVDPQNIDALNRLAKANFELGKINLARKYYTQVLRFDSYNPIASKNLKIIKAFRKNGLQHHISADGLVKMSSSLFLQEPGKSKIVSLLKVAEPQKLSQLYPCMPVNMVIKNHRITVVDQTGIYLGILPDDLSHQMVRFIRGGNRYEAFIKSVRVNSLSVLIRETYRSKRFKNQPSFLDAYKGYQLTEIITSLDSDEGDDEQSDEEENLV